MLATPIAESAVTIEDVRLVIDSGLSRVPVFEPVCGLTRLETRRACRASVDQRAGRAGRNRPGIAVRLWHEGQTAARPPYPAAEILTADLSGLLLDCAAFGVSDPAALRLADRPPQAALKEARALLLRLGAVDPSGYITPVGRSMRRSGLPVRLAHMMSLAAERGGAQAAAELALVLSERGLGGKDADLDRRLDTFRHDSSERASKARALARRLCAQAGAGHGGRQTLPARAGALLIDAWPDRVARLRGKEAGQYLLANGRGAALEATSPLGLRPWLVVGALSGTAGQARILAAAEIDEETVRRRLAGDIRREVESFYDPATGSLHSREREVLGAIVLRRQQMPPPSGAAANAAWSAAVCRYGPDVLPWSSAAANLRQRLRWLRQGLGAPWPDVSDAVLQHAPDEWLLPYLPGRARLDGAGADFLLRALKGLVPYALQHRVDAFAPTHFVVPTGAHIPIRYEGVAPVLSVRVQELFGLSSHPAIAGNRVPLVVELLSPAGRSRSPPICPVSGKGHGKMFCRICAGTIPNMPGLMIRLLLRRRGAQSQGKAETARGQRARSCVNCI